MQTFEQRRFRRSIAVGLALTVLVCIIDQLSLLSVLDGWFYDQRFIHAQSNSRRPDMRIEHIDIDEAALDVGAVGRWPWSHEIVARIIDEIGRANPLALGLDIYLSEPESAKADAALAAALGRQKNLVLIADLEFPAAIDVSSVEKAAIREMAGNLELGSTELVQHIRMQLDGLDSIYDVDNLFVRARKSAMHIRVQQEMRSGPVDDAELMRKLLPHVDPLVNAPVVRVLKEEAAICRATQAMGRFGFKVPTMPIPPIPTEFRTLNLDSFTRNARFSGFVNYDMFKSSTVRSVPLFVESDHLLYPQFGVAFACALLGADPRLATVQANQCTIPVPGGEPIKIPTHTFYSTTLHREVSSIIDIPWFGTSDWLTMYDWPAHARQANHISVNVVWDICKAVDRIRKNNLEIDQTIQDLLGGDVGGYELNLSLARQYKDSVPDSDDRIARERIAQTALKELSDAQWLEGYAKIPAAELKPDEKAAYDGLKRAKAALETLVASNRELDNQVTVQRKALNQDVAGKGVLFGWTAEGLTDHVNTSLQPRCPGVVVHGVIAEAVLTNHWPRAAPNWVGLLIVIFVGLTVAYIVAYFQPARAFAGTLALVVGYFLLNFLIFFDRGGWFVPVAGPVVAITVVWSGCTLQRVIFESVERNRVATEAAIINREMDLARKVQAALIPTRPPVIPGLEANGWTQAASVAGGDCYDLWTLPDGRLGILLADASGHGLAPAMVVSQVRTLVRALCDVESHPHELLKRINTRVAEDLEPGRFVTVFLGFLSSDGVLEYASAGHGPQFWYGCDGEEMEILDSTGAPLGADTEWLCDDPMPPIQMGAGCSLVVFSDGIFESMTPTGELFGIDRLKEILHDNRNKPGKIILDLITNAMQDWQHKRPPADDQTVVIARRVQTEKVVEQKSEPELATAAFA